MSARRTRKPSASTERPLRGRADLQRLKRVSERAIARTSPPELSNLPDDFWSEAQLVWPGPKQAISLRLDRDILDWFRAQGPRYQSRMNTVLRTYMTHAKRRRTRSGTPK